MLESLKNLLVHGLIGLSEILSSLGMSDDDIFHARIGQHVRSDLAGIGALLLEIHILSADLDVASLCSLYSRNDVDGRHAEYHVSLICNHKGL